MRVRYEGILKDTEKTMRRICKFLGINFEPQLCGKTDFEVTSYSKKFHALVGEPPQQERAVAWKQELTEREVELFEANTGELLDHFGYERLFPHTTATTTRLERLKFYIVEQVERVVDKIRFRWRREQIS